MNKRSDTYVYTVTRRFWLSDRSVDALHSIWARRHDATYWAKKLRNEDVYAFVGKRKVRRYE